jgi:hypothetical protein
VTTLTVNDTPPTPSILGLPTGSVLEGLSTTLTAAASDPSQADTNAGFNYLWEATDATETELYGNGLILTGANSITLPSGLVHNTNSFLIELTFQTTAGGVLLGYQNATLGGSPSRYVPAIYVGTNGLLYAELWDGAVAPLHSTTPVNDGKPHTVVLVDNNNQQRLFLDGNFNFVGSITSTFQPLDMTFNQLGNGFTYGWPGGNGGVFPFVGTISRVAIDSVTAPVTGPNPTLAQDMLVEGAAFRGSMDNQVTFMPPDAGTYSVSLLASDKNGGTGIQTASITATEAPVTLTAGSGAVVQQGTTFTGSVSIGDAAADAPWTATVNYGDGTARQTSIIQSAFNSGSSTLVFFSHVYNNAGLFPVTVTVTNAEGQSGTTTFNVTVSGFTVNDGSPQQSMVKSLTYTFPSPTQVEPGAFELLRDGKPCNINLHVTPQSDGKTYLITFKGPGVIGGSVPDGHYTLITRHNKIRVLSGPPMTQDDLNTFVRLFGDVNGDGLVNAADKALLEQAEANPASTYVPDFEYDGKPGIDKTDIAQFNERDRGSALKLAKSPAKFRGRTVYHQAPTRKSSSRFALRSGRFSL